VKSPRWRCGLRTDPQHRPLRYFTRDAVRSFRVLSACGQAGIGSTKMVQHRWTFNFHGRCQIRIGTSTLTGTGGRRQRLGGRRGSGSREPAARPIRYAALHTERIMPTDRSDHAPIPGRDRRISSSSYGDVPGTGEPANRASINPPIAFAAAGSGRGKTARPGLPETRA